VLIGVGVTAAAVLTIGAGTAAACKLFFDCGTGAEPRYDENYLRGLGPGPATKLPAGFTEEVVAAKLEFPTDFAFLPDRRLLLAEKHGVVRIFDRGRMLATPFLDISKTVDTGDYRGLMAIQVDPAFAENGYVYLLYSYHGSPSGPIVDQLLRVTARGDTTVPGSQRVLLGAVSDHRCHSLPAGTDCIAAEHDHIGGDIAFASDGTMFVSTGDGGPDMERPTQLHAQDLDYLNGKILHITRDGKGVASNPFWNGDADANRSKVWAYGLRNPFRMVLNPSTGTPIVGDVGQDRFEEVDVARRGGNLGWPCYEGVGHYARFADSDVCTKLYRTGPRAKVGPAIVYRHGVPSGGQSITGGGFYTGKTWPANYRGVYVYGDWERGWMRTLRFDASDRLTSGPEPFVTGAGGPVAIREGPDGSLYYIAFNASQLRRISFGGK
jgi:glucose/arabinose dehydrogenase